MEYKTAALSPSFLAYGLQLHCETDLSIAQRISDPISHPLSLNRCVFKVVSTLTLVKVQMSL